MNSDEDASRPRIEANGQRSIAAGQIGTANTGDVLPAEALHAPTKYQGDSEMVEGCPHLPRISRGRGSCKCRKDRRWEPGRRVAVMAPAVLQHGEGESIASAPEFTRSHQCGKSFSSML